MEYEYPIEKFSFKPSIINVPKWFSLNLGKVFEIHILEDQEMHGYVFFVLVLPEKTDPDEGGTLKEVFNSHFYNLPSHQTYSIPREEFDLSKLPDLASFEIKHFSDPREYRVDSCGIYMQIKGTSFFGYAFIEDDLFSFDKDVYLENANDEQELNKEKEVQKKMDALEKLDINIMRDHKNDS